MAHSSPIITGMLACHVSVLCTPMNGAIFSSYKLLKQLLLDKIFFCFLTHQEVCLTVDLHFSKALFSVEPYNL